ncbi:YkyB family protein [Fredinandcohnia onubensis]|uniref:YkyB family protein n=1 Tax=Fredinandcohnia onubensis TaxID=1571209 RepID=UPI000C0BBA6E|nr:YkyB family protein [Fredinandcohnia onubensis]
MIIKVEQIAQAIQVINRHAKTPKDFPDFYKLKNDAIKLSIKKGYAKKIGLDYYYYPHMGRKEIFTSIQIDRYFFHTTPTDSDLRNLKMIYRRYRNPNICMSLKEAETVILTFLNNEKYVKKPTKKISHHMRMISDWIERR